MLRNVFGCVRHEPKSGLHVRAARMGSPSFNWQVSLRYRSHLSYAEAGYGGISGAAVVCNPFSAACSTFIWLSRLAW